MKLKLAGGLAVTLVLTIGLLVAAPRANKALTPAEEVRTALQKINTWHLTGWTLVDGKRVPWEVWGRRTPFFYREQVGEDIVLDDGRQRVAIFAPHSERWRPDGVFLRAPSAPESQNVRWSYERMVEHWKPEWKPWQQTTTEAVFNERDVNMDGPGTVSDCLYTVNKRDWLPIQYELRKGNGKTRQTTAFLRTEYNTPLPETALRPPQTMQGYRIYDTQKIPLNLPEENVVHKDGLTVQVKPLLLDKQGNLLLQVRGWFGDTLIDEQSPIRLYADVPRTMNGEELLPYPTTDDQSRPYTAVYWSRMNYSKKQGEPQLIALTPLEPLEPNAPLPNSLSLFFNVSLTTPSGMSKTMGMTDDRLLQHNMTLTVQLPKPVESLEQSVRVYMNPNWREHLILLDGMDSLQANIYHARSLHYGFLIDHRQLKTPRMQRYAYWLEKYIETGTSSGVQMFRFRLAEHYRQLGQMERTRQILKDAIMDKQFDRPPSLPSHLSPEQSQRALMEYRRGVEKNRQSAKRMLLYLDQSVKP